jgi:hypothetical protein
VENWCAQEERGRGVRGSGHGGGELWEGRSMEEGNGRWHAWGFGEERESELQKWRRSVRREGAEVEVGSSSHTGGKGKRSMHEEEEAELQSGGGQVVDGWPATIKN